MLHVIHPMILENRLTLKFMLGVTYILEKMPAGYCLFDRPRSTDSQMVSTFGSGCVSCLVYYLLTIEKARSICVWAPE